MLWLNSESAWIMHSFCCVQLHLEAIEISWKHLLPTPVGEVSQQNFIIGHKQRCRIRYRPREHEKPWSRSALSSDDVRRALLFGQTPIEDEGLLKAKSTFRLTRTFPISVNGPLRHTRSDTWLLIIASPVSVSANFGGLLGSLICRILRPEDIQLLLSPLAIE